jgi:hypothetical protein
LDCRIVECAIQEENVTTKEDYSDEEWQQVIMAPGLAGMVVIASDPSVTGMVKEIKAMGKAIEEKSAPEAAQELVASVVAEMQAQAEKKEEGQQNAEHPAPDEDGLAHLLEQLRGAAAVLDTRAAPDEAKGYKQWVVSVAVTVANAAKEGGFLGIGGELISNKEKAALESISSALGL